MTVTPLLRGRRSAVLPPLAKPGSVRRRVQMVWRFARTDRHYLNVSWPRSLWMAWRSARTWPDWSRTSLRTPWLYAAGGFVAGGALAAVFSASVLAPLTSVPVALLGGWLWGTRTFQTKRREAAADA